MITGTLKTQVDAIWDMFWSNGVSNPLTVIEQMSYLIFMRALDDVQNARERKATMLKRSVEHPIYGDDQHDIRWRNLLLQSTGKAALELINRPETGAFAFIKALGRGGSPDETTGFARFMDSATFTVPERILVPVIEKIEALPLTDRDTKGDLYEYMLSRLAQAGTNGQFRTPRHIIRMMVELMEPTPTDTICDPACGTAGFLIGAAEYIREHHPEVERDAKLFEHFNTTMFSAFDFETTMLRIASMNLFLHGVERPNIDDRDSLSQDSAGLKDQYSLVLANPPFKGNVDYEGVATDLLSVTKTKKTELLFVALILRLLKTGGRAAVIVPDGVLFGSSGAHEALRKTLIEEHKLEAIISMPPGVFKPYAGVSTGIAIFTKTGVGGTDQVWFYDMTADGFSLDDKRDPVEANDIPDVVAAYRTRDFTLPCDRKTKWFWVPKAELVTNDYDLSINRYKEVVHDQTELDSPSEIIARLRKLESEIADGLDALEGLL